VVDDGKGVACVEGVLADAAAELDYVTARLAVDDVDGGQGEEIANHREKVAGVDSIGSRLRGRLFFHEWFYLPDSSDRFSHTGASAVRSRWTC
jgi:hypothetical protein